MKDQAVSEIATPSKPCPFCGDIDSLYIERVDLSSCVVICDACSCRGPESCTENDEELQTEEENEFYPGQISCVKAWNKRFSEDS